MDKSKFEQLTSYATKPGQKFVWVYRGEGKEDPEFVTNSGNPERNGTWFTELFVKANDFKEIAKDKGNTDCRIVACVVTQEHLDQRPPLDKGMREMCLFFVKDINLKEVTEPITEVPTADDYLNQFKGYKEYTLEQQLETKEGTEAIAGTI